MMSENKDFVPSPPLGPTENPDSPIVQEADAVSTAGPQEPESSLCFYDNQAYGEGSRICMLGEVHYCSSGSWVRTGLAC